jgi:hypothetical protein
MEAAYVRPVDREDAMVTLQVSGDLATWTAVAATPTITDNGDGTETVLWADVIALSGNPDVTADHGFVRLLVDTPCDPASATLPQGWSRQYIDGKYQTYGRNLVKMPLFTGYIDSVSGNTISTTTSGKGEDLSAYLPAETTGYLEITRGVHEGHRFDLAGGGVDSFTIDPASAHNTAAALPSDLAGHHFIVRAHHTLGGLYAGTLEQASFTPGSADQVLFYNGTGYDTYFKFAAGAIWVRQGFGVTSQDGLVVPSGTGMMVTHADPTSTSEILALGAVRYNDFRRPVVLGQTGLNFVSQGYPLDASPGSLAMNTGNGFAASGLLTQAAQILTWRGDSTVNATGWTTYFQLLDDRWFRVGAVNPGGPDETDTRLMLYDSAVLIDVQSDQLNWKHTMPWDPSPWFQAPVPTAP